MSGTLGCFGSSSESEQRCKMGVPIIVPQEFGAPSGKCDAGAIVAGYLVRR